MRLRRIQRECYQPTRVGLIGLLKNETIIRIKRLLNLEIAELLGGMRRDENANCEFERKKFVKNVLRLK